MKQLLSLLLILLFSFQALPVKELGKLLVKKALTEQVEDEAGNAADLSKQSPEKELDKLFVSAHVFHFSAIYTEERVKVALHNLPLFEDHFHPDISTPPPNA